MVEDLKDIYANSPFKNQSKDDNPTCTGSGLAILQYDGNPNLYTPHDFPGYHAAYWKCNECTACT